MLLALFVGGAAVVEETGALVVVLPDALVEVALVILLEVIGAEVGLAVVLTLVVIVVDTAPGMHCE